MPATLHSSGPGDILVAAAAEAQLVALEFAVSTAAGTANAVAVEPAAAAWRTFPQTHSLFFCPNSKYNMLTALTPDKNQRKRNQQFGQREAGIEAMLQYFQLTLSCEKL